VNTIRLDLDDGLMAFARNLEHSTIMYETVDKSPLLRLAWNKQDPNYVAVVALDSERVIILDVRVPSVAVTELVGHIGALNSVAWAPHSAHHICTAGKTILLCLHTLLINNYEADDHQALVWDVSALSQQSSNTISQGSPPLYEPILSYRAGAEINQLSWSGSQTEWVAVGFGNTVQALKI